LGEGVRREREGHVSRSAGKLCPVYDFVLMVFHTLYSTRDDRKT